MLFAPAINDLDYLSLVNWDDPLTQSLLLWHLNLPGRYGGTRAYDLAQGRLLTRTSMASPPTSTSGPGTTSRPGGWGEERFDGTDDHINLGTLGTFGAQMFTLKPTLSLWIKTTSTAPAWALGVRNDNSAPRFELRLNLDHTSSEVSGALNGGIYDSGGNTLIFGTAASVGFNNGQWHHVAVGYDGPNNLGAIWVDGVPKTVSYGSQLTPTTGANFTIGLYLGGFNDGAAPLAPMVGAVDDLMLFTRPTLLSTAEVQALTLDGRTFHPRMLRRVAVPWGKGAAFAPLVGDAALTQDNQTLSSSGTLPLVGQAALTQADQSLSSAGVLALSGALAQTQGDATLSSTGTLPLSGQAAVTQDDAALSSAGTVALAGSASLSQSPQTLGSTALLLLRGNASLVQDEQTLSSSDVAGIIGTLSVTQDSQILSATQHMTMVAARTFIVEAEDRTHSVEAVG